MNMSDRHPYPDSFYNTRDRRSRYSAETILTMALDILPPIGSAADFGCGVGTWLSVAQSGGVEHIQGYEGRWLDPALLEIEPSQFDYRDFSAKIDTHSPPRFDLAISLEVAEHLPESNATPFVALLTATADFVLFSAAIPLQGGKGHYNEQWPGYWIALFESHGFKALDPFRHRIWDDTDIRPWYRQNTLLMVKRERLDALSIDADDPAYTPRALVHPEVFLFALGKKQKQIDHLSTVPGAWKSLRRALRSRLGTSGR